MFVRLREKLDSPVSWGAVLLAYIGTIGALAFTLVSANKNADAVRAETTRAASALAVEANNRERDLCQVVVNVHNNAKFRYQAEKRRLRATKDYLLAIDPPRTELDRRVAANLKNVRADVEVARRNVRATRVPPTCAPYRLRPDTTTSPGSDRAQN